VTGGEPEPTVFLVGEHAVEVLGLDEIVRVLRHFGFDPLLARALDADARKRSADRGPSVDGEGEPAAVVVALHHAPVRPKGATRAQHPRLSNVDVLRAEERLRARVRTFNPVRSSVDEVEAWECVALALPDDAAALRADVERRRASYRTDERVRRVLSRGRRAKVELLDGGVVRKTYAEGFHSHLAREVAALHALGGHVDVVPDVLEVGPNWFTAPYYVNVLGDLGDLGREGKLLPLSVVRGMVAAVAELRALGYDVIDAKPHNFVLDPRHGLKMLDFEFAHRHAGPAPPLAQSWALIGPPADFEGDRPVGNLSYDFRWRPLTGMSPDDLVGASVWVQHGRRLQHRLRRITTGPNAPVRLAVRRGRRAARCGRRAVDQLHGWWARRRRVRA